MEPRINQTRLFIGLVLLIALGLLVFPAGLTRAKQEQGPFPRGADNARGLQGAQTTARQIENLPPGRLPDPGNRPTPQPNDLVEVTIEMSDPPAVEAYRQATTRALSTAQRIRNAQTHLAKLAQTHETLLATLASRQINATVIGRLQRVYNGVTVQVEAGKVDEISRLPGVKAVHPVTVLHPISNAAVPFIGTPAAWTSGMGIRGEGIKVGVIDSGIDYLHTNFGGPGSGYANNNTTIVGDAPNFPGVKVAGGYDFVGDNYDAGSSDPARHIPHPDLDPMDCQGHGTAVASALAGYGVNANGTTYAGPYDTNTPFSSMKIMPGVAPAVSLYALRVFGCKGTVADPVIAQAIEWAVDPNGDGDFSDHLDVINLSIGTKYVLPDDPAVVAGDKAALAGVIVVGAIGNSGDAHYIGGGPGSAGRAICAAGSRDNGFTYLGMQVNSPASIAGQYSAAPAGFGPPLSAAGITGNLVAASPSNACTALANPAAVNGKIALVDQAFCNFVTPVRNAQAAGAVAVIVVKNYAGPPFIMGDDGTGSDITIPSVMISQSDGALLKANLPNPGVNVTLSSSTIIARPDLADTLTDFTSRGPRNADSVLKPDITAPAELITTAFFGTGTEAGTATGTSLAAPLLAGGMTLLRQMHPTWSVEELKALAMNTATFDLFTGPNFTSPRYAPARVGAGRLALQNAVADSVVAYNADDPGLVGVSFGVVEVATTITLTKNIRVVNKGASPASYNLSYDGITDIPGVSYSFPGGTSVNVPAGGSTTFQVRLDANAAQMKHTRDASLLTAIQGFTQGFTRHWLSEESGFIRLTPASGTTLRLPVYATARPVSMMGTTQTQLDFATDTGMINLNLNGQGVNTGSSYPFDIISLASPFELQEISPDDPSSTGFSNMADLKYIGVKSDFNLQGSVANTTISFGIATQRAWSSPNTVGFEIYIDLNGDGIDDYLLFNDSLTSPQNSNSDVFVCALKNLANNNTVIRFALNGFLADQFDTVPFNTNVAFLLVSAADLGLTEANARFSYHVKTLFNDQNLNAFAPAQIDASHRLTYDVKKQGLSFNSSGLYFDVNGNTIPVQYNRQNFQANGSLGLLLLHHHNAAGLHAQVLPAVIPFDVCLQDDSNRSAVLQLNSQTGDYRFCCGGTTYVGKGVVSVRGTIVRLQDSTTTRRLLALVDRSTRRGNASIQGTMGSCAIMDRDITNNTCNCAAP